MVDNACSLQIHWPESCRMREMIREGQPWWERVACWHHMWQQDIGARWLTPIHRRLKCSLKVKVPVYLASKILCSWTMESSLGFGWLGVFWRGSLSAVWFYIGPYHQERILLKK